MFFKMQNFSYCGLFGFFHPEIKKFLSHFLAFSCPFLICFFKSVLEKSTKFVWFVKDKQFACWQVLIKSDRSHLSICDESKDDDINWHYKCSIDWLCAIDVTDRPTNKPTDKPTDGPTDWHNVWWSHVHATKNISFWTQLKKELVSYNFLDHHPAVVLFHKGTENEAVHRTIRV